MGRSPSPRRREEAPYVRERRDDRRDRDRDRRRVRSRTRSRSPDRRRRSPDRRRSPSPPRRRRSPSPRRRRSRSSSPGPSTVRPRAKRTSVHDRPIITPEDLEGKSPEEQEMLKIMGFCGFDSTKGKKVEDNVEGDVHVVLKRKYRQYMNRKGGFNRPLDYVA